MSRATWLIFKEFVPKEDLEMRVREFETWLSFARYCTTLTKSLKLLQGSVNSPPKQSSYYLYLMLLF